MYIFALLAFNMLNFFTSPVSCGRCPDVLPCRCLWDISPTTTVCRINILHLKARAGIIQARTQKLILQVNGLDPEIQYDSDLWGKLESVITTSGMYNCEQGVCYLKTESPNNTSKATKLWTVTPASKRMIPKIVPSTFNTAPACFTTTSSTVYLYTCSTTTLKTDGIKYTVTHSWMWYAPLICLATLVLLVMATVSFKRFRSRPSHSGDRDCVESDSSICLYDVSAPSVMGMKSDAEPRESMITETKFTSPVAGRTRSQRAPISSRLRSANKQE